MSRAPTAIARQTQSEVPAEQVIEQTASPPPVDTKWFDIDGESPREIVLLTTADPLSNGDGIPARWYVRRQYVAGRWRVVASWVDPATLVSLDPQPTHWRVDPARGLLLVPAA
jgi:hypothetical protein